MYHMVQALVRNSLGAHCCHAGTHIHVMIEIGWLQHELVQFFEIVPDSLLHFQATWLTKFMHSMV